MADTALCSIPDCGNGVAYRGWCRKHYERWRKHGDPTAYKIVNRSRDFILQALKSEQDDCIEWPYSKWFGYGRSSFDGSTTLAHRQVCSLAHGPEPFKLAEAAHNCGNRGCVNPRHLRWATRQSNNDDIARHGRTNHGSRNGAAKLTEAQVLQIRADNRRDADIAAEFGCRPNTIWAIQNRRLWKHLP